MPDCLLEYSDNIHEEFDNHSLFHSLHLALSRNGRFRIDEIHSRAVIHSRYFVGDGRADNAFIHLQVRTNQPIPEVERKELGSRLVALLKAQFNYSVEQLRCNITVELIDAPSDRLFLHRPRSPINL